MGSAVIGSVGQSDAFASNSCKQPGDKHLVTRRTEGQQVAKRSRSSSASTDVHTKRVLRAPQGDNIVDGSNSPRSTSSTANIHLLDQLLDASENGISLLRRVASDSAASINVDQFATQDKISNYKLLRKIAEGGYGVVFEAKCVASGEIVAVKTLKNTCRTMLSPRTFRELMLLQQLPAHANVVGCRSVCLSQSKDYKIATPTVHVIMDFLPLDLPGFLRGRGSSSGIGRLVLSELKCIVSQILLGAQHLHRLNIVHRDIKPENLLVAHSGHIRLADLSFGRFVDDAANSPPYTVNVSSLWYRPPEVLLGYQYYDCSIDVWSIGCVMGELLLERALFAECSEERVLQAIWARCGTPSQDVVDGLFSKFPGYKFFFPQQSSVPNWFDIISKDSRSSHGSNDGTILLQQMLNVNFKHRVTVSQALHSDWMRSEPLPCSHFDLMVPKNVSHGVQNRKNAPNRQVFPREHVLVAAQSSSSASSPGIASIDGSQCQSVEVLDGDDDGALSSSMSEASNEFASNG